MGASSWAGAVQMIGKGLEFGGFRESAHRKPDRGRHLVPQGVTGIALRVAFEKRLGRRQGAFLEGAHGGVHGVVVKRGGVDGQVGRAPFREDLRGHIVFVDAGAGVSWSSM